MMGEQCKARHPQLRIQCERNAEHNHKALASERGTHRAELPPRTSGPFVQPGPTVVSW